MPMPSHVLRAECIRGNGGYQGGIDAAAQGNQDLAESAFADVVARAKHQSVDSFRIFSLPRSQAGGADGDSVSTITRSSSKDFARATTVPSSAIARTQPSKMRLSLPPTWLHHQHRLRGRARQWPPASFAAVRAWTVKEGEEEMLMISVPRRISSSSGSKLYRRCGQKFLSFQASSQMEMASRRRRIPQASGFQPRAKYRCSSKTS